MVFIKRFDHSIKTIINKCYIISGLIGFIILKPPTSDYFLLKPPSISAHDGSFHGWNLWSLKPQKPPLKRRN